MVEWFVGVKCVSKGWGGMFVGCVMGKCMSISIDYGGIKVIVFVNCVSIGKKKVNLVHILYNFIENMLPNCSD